MWLANIASTWVERRHVTCQPHDWRRRLSARCRRARKQDTSRKQQQREGAFTTFTSISYPLIKQKIQYYSILTKQASMAEFYEPKFIESLMDLQQVPWPDAVVNCPARGRGSSVDLRYSCGRWRKWALLQYYELRQSRRHFCQPAAYRSRSQFSIILLLVPSQPFPVVSVFVSLLIFWCYSCGGFPNRIGFDNHYGRWVGGFLADQSNSRQSQNRLR